MKRIYKSIFLLALASFSLHALAQRADSTLTRQVLLERDYNPTLNEATKINTKPNIYKTKTQATGDIQFVNQSPKLTIPANKLGQVASGDIKTEVPFHKEIFYLNIGAGSYGNMDGAIGVRALNTGKDKLDIFGTYNATSGKVDYLEPSIWIKKAKAKYADMKANVNYEHDFTSSIFKLGAYYQNIGYNYYGNPFINSDNPHLQPTEGVDINPLEHMDMDTKQKVDVFSVYAGIRSSETNEGALRYAGNLSYTNFTSKYGFSPMINKGPRGGIVEADADFSAKLGLGYIGIAGNILTQAFGSKSSYSSVDGDFRGYANIGATPYYKIDKLEWDLTIGVNLNYVHDKKNKFIVTPNVLAQFHIHEVNTFYVGVTEGVNNNTFLDILHENRYTNPSSRVQYSKTTYDAKIGFRSGVISNFEFDLFAGYKQVKDDHLFATHNLYIIADPQPQLWSNMSSPIYAKISTGHIGGAIKTNLIPKTTLTAKAIGYFYSVKNISLPYGNKAWGRPSFTAELTADIKPMDKLTVSLSYLLAAGRKGIRVGQSFSRIGVEGTPSEPEIGTGIPNQFLAVNTGNMKTINELNIGAEFEIIKYLSIHARVNNVLNQKYEQQVGYTLQGMNVIGGFNFKF